MHNVTSNGFSCPFDLVHRPQIRAVLRVSEGHTRVVLEGGGGAVDSKAAEFKRLGITTLPEFKEREDELLTSAQKYGLQYYDGHQNNAVAILSTVSS